jgi:serine/threonine protein kinase
MSAARPNISRRNPEQEFELLKRIGSGTYGEVYKGRVIKSNQMTALKIIKIEQGDDFAIIQQEIGVLQECSHANIVAYFGSYLKSVCLSVYVSVHLSVCLSVIDLLF